MVILAPSKVPSRQLGFKRFSSEHTGVGSRVALSQSGFVISHVRIANEEVVAVFVAITAVGQGERCPSGGQGDSCCRELHVEKKTSSF